MEQQQEQQGRGQQSSLYPPCIFPLLGHSFPVAPFSLTGFSSSLFFFLFSEREGGKEWRGDVCGKGPVPFPASLPAGCSPQPVPRLVAVPEGGQGGAVPGTPCQAEPSSPARLSAPRRGEKPLSPSRRAARSACFSLPCPQTPPRCHRRDSVRRAAFGPTNPKEPGMGATGGGGPSFGRYDLWRQMSRPAIQNTTHCVGNGPLMTGITPLILIEPFKAAVSWALGRRASSAGVGATWAGGGPAAAPGAGSEQVLAGRAPSAPGRTKARLARGLRA